MPEKTLKQIIEIEGADIVRDPNSLMGREYIIINLNKAAQESGYNIGEEFKYKISIEPKE